MSDSEPEDGDGPEGEGDKKKEWNPKVATHLSFIAGFNAFPGKRPGGLNPSLVFDAVQVGGVCARGAGPWACSGVLFQRRMRAILCRTAGQRQRPGMTHACMRRGSAATPIEPDNCSWSRATSTRQTRAGRASRM